MEEILKLIGTYGLPLVISALVVYGAFQSLEIFLDRFRTREERRHMELVDYRRKVNREVTILLERLMLKADASRAFVFEFHNGDSGLGGMPFLKMSNTFETVNAGVRAESHNLQGLPCSLYSDLLQKIEGEAVVLLDVHNRQSDISNLTYELLVEQDISRTLLVQMVDNKGLAIGYMGLDFNNGCSRPFDGSYVGLLSDAAIKIGALLSVK